jgi:hypothetical protein
MKKKLLILLFVTAISQAQFVVTPNPFNINSGTITVKYGQSGNYSLFNPNSDPNLFLYTGLETDGVVATWDYTDDFANTATQIPFTYNIAEGCYLATFNIATRNYKNATNNVVGPLPAGLTVNNWYFIIKNAAGNAQSADLKGSDFGFTAAVLSNNNFEINLSDVYVSNNSITSKIEGVSEVSIFNMLGQEIKTLKINQFETKDLNIQQNGIFIALIKNNGSTLKIKFQN